MSAQPPPTPTPAPPQPADPASVAPVLQKAPQPPTAAETAWQARLEALDGRDAQSYFNLAEEVGDAAITAEEVALAQRLFVISFELDRLHSGGKGGPLAASSCLGLAWLSRREPERRWLVALAGQIDPRHATPAWLAAEQVNADTKASAQLSLALCLLRAGEGTQAAQLFADPAVRGLLDRYQRLLSGSGSIGPSTQLTMEANRWPCPDCGNSRVVKRSNKAGDVRLCLTCAGNPGPRLSDAEYIAQLRLESLLLSGIHRSWGAQIGADNGEPLRDPDPSELAPTFGIDPTRALFKAGAWVAK